MLTFWTWEFDMKQKVLDRIHNLKGRDTAVNNAHVTDTVTYKN